VFLVHALFDSCHCHERWSQAHSLRYRCRASKGLPIRPRGEPVERPRIAAPVAASTNMAFLTIVRRLSDNCRR
jgi:hypothetical protein